jgi:16S rRNA (guanine966-N2)-methyltransferase
VLVERDRSALEALTQNVAQLDLGDRVAVVRLDVQRFVAGRPPGEAPFGLVFADPPYDTTDEAVAGLIGALAAPGWLGRGAVVAVERPARAAIAVPEGFRAHWERTFGDTLVFFVDAAEPPS